ncbi:glycosyltransferase [Balneolaceae bacterium YR4-1]|uniref:Glycosyltransferase n=1 Tax=Halalkalibaculum roseum TaxID=2709311 RepID=A0A6M1ST24_9BACT|nr:glycosyltransferase family 2 protein [Halalkalibaculum roseum]NGP75942.1 glycosyltransferase [Halalkalibaculum roseum]
MAKLSIITINLNNVDGLKKTIESVLNQTFSDFEYIIIDGASEDGSLETIKQFSDRISYWVSEPDKGIYNAMNKGIKKAKGEYIIFMNSGDYFNNSKILERIFSIERKADFIIGEIEMFMENKNLKTNTPQNISFELLYNGTIYHQATFTKKTVFEQLGGYNENKQITSDWEFITLALAKHNMSYKVLDVEVANVDATGISTTNPDLVKKERAEMLENNFSLFIPDYEKLNRLEKLTFGYLLKLLYKKIRKLYWIAQKRLKDLKISISP